MAVCCSHTVLAGALSLLIYGGLQVSDPNESRDEEFLFLVARMPGLGWGVFFLALTLMVGVGLPHRFLESSHIQRVRHGDISRAFPMNIKVVRIGMYRLESVRSVDPLCRTTARSISYCCVWISDIPRCPALAFDVLMLIYRINHSQFQVFRKSSAFMVYRHPVSFQNVTGQDIPDFGSGSLRLDLQNHGSHFV